MPGVSRLVRGFVSACEPLLGPWASFRLFRVCLFDSYCFVCRHLAPLFWQEVTNNECGEPCVKLRSRVLLHTVRFYLKHFFSQIASWTRVSRCWTFTFYEAVFSGALIPVSRLQTALQLCGAFDWFTWLWPRLRCDKPKDCEFSAWSEWPGSWFRGDSVSKRSSLFLLCKEPVSTFPVTIATKSLSHHRLALTATGLCKFVSGKTYSCRWLWGATTREWGPCMCESLSRFKGCCLAILSFSKRFRDFKTSEWTTGWSIGRNHSLSGAKFSDRRVPANFNELGVLRRTWQVSTVTWKWTAPCLPGRNGRNLGVSKASKSRNAKKVPVEAPDSSYLAICQGDLAAVLAEGQEAGRRDAQ